MPKLKIPEAPPPPKEEIRPKNTTHPGTIAEMHGAVGLMDEHSHWKKPKMVAMANCDARPGYNSMKAHEYKDAESTLNEKIDQLAQLMFEAEDCVVYTGAGISTAAGIGDYASKAKGSMAGRKNHSLNPLKAEPTTGHRVLANLEKRGYIAHWVNQNHDGLAQKAGFPQSKLNEIHGSWFDRTNPVVQMNGELRSDLFQWLLEWEQKADLVISMGSTMCGMNADRLADTASKKAKKGQSLGLVIINLQATPYDDKATLRIYGTLDHVLQKLADRLRVPSSGLVSKKPKPPRLPARKGSVERRQSTGASSSQQPRQSTACVIGNHHRRLGTEEHQWTMFVKPDDPSRVTQVGFQLHPTFSPSYVSISEAPFEITRIGWGTFDIGVTITLDDGTVRKYEHHLSFDGDGALTQHLM